MAMVRLFHLTNFCWSFPVPWGLQAFYWAHTHVTLRNCSILSLLRVLRDEPTLKFSQCSNLPSPSQPPPPPPKKKGTQDFEVCFQTRSCFTALRERESTESFGASSGQKLPFSTLTPNFWGAGWHQGFLEIKVPCTPQPPASQHNGEETCVWKTLVCIA